MKKIRLDLLLLQKNYFTSRNEAQSAIMNKKVSVNDVIITKAGTLVLESANIIVNQQEQQFVSRGGYKLEKAIHEFKININNLICLDVGSSTGGFTDCMLQNGALKVYSLDVGTNQLAWKIRINPQVVVMENTNFRYATKEMFNEPVTFCAIDVSFISLKKIILPLTYILEKDAQVVCLVKPQFETTKNHIEKGGVVKNLKVHQNLLEELIIFFKQSGFVILNLTYSPITGNKKGNIEYLIHLKFNSQLKTKIINVAKIVQDAYSNLKKT